MSTDPWTVYWQGNNLASCIASKIPEDSDEIAVFWKQLASGLATGSSVLDLACGNGMVPKLLLTTNSTLDVCAVDKAQIAPHEYLQNVEELASVRFLPQTDICDLPFAADSFSAVTSQFGLEYAPINLACESAVRVLKKQGEIRLLMHNQKSEIVRPAAATVAEIGRLLGDQGVILGIESYLSKNIDLDQLESIGRQYLESDVVRTQQVSGQIFTGINQIIGEIKSNPERAKALMVNMKARLLADQERLVQMQKAALSTDDADHVAQLLEGLGINLRFCKPFSLAETDGGQVLIGWQISGTKT